MREAGPRAAASSLSSRLSARACALPRPAAGPRGHTHLAGAGAGAGAGGRPAAPGAGDDTGTLARRGRRRRAGGRKAGRGRSGPAARRLQSLAANRGPAPPCVRRGAAARVARPPPGTRYPPDPRPRDLACARVAVAVAVAAGRGRNPTGAGGWATRVSDDPRSLRLSLSSEPGPRGRKGGRKEGPLPDTLSCFL